MIEKKQASSFYPYFEQEERPTIDYFVGLFNRVLYQGEPVLTDFLDPRKRQILQTVAGGEIMLDEDGGYDEAEKKRVYLTSDWLPLPKKEFGVSLLEISYPQKFAQLRHSQILGSLANSGVKTETFGDIVTDGQGRWQFFAEKELVPFFSENIYRMGPVKVKLEEVEMRDLLAIEDGSKALDGVAASLRLDAVLAALSGKSRTQLKQALEAGEVRLNWHPETKAEKEVQIGDLVSLRHFGRVKILSIYPTKKGRFHLEGQFWPAKRQ